MPFVAQRYRQTVADGIEQRHPAMATTNLWKRCQQARDHSAKDADEHIQRAARDCSGIAPVWILMGLGSHADGRRNGAEIECKGTEGRKYQRGHPVNVIKPETGMS